MRGIGAAGRCRQQPRNLQNCGVSGNDGRNPRTHRDVGGIQPGAGVVEVEFKIYMWSEYETMGGATEVEHAQLLAFFEALSLAHCDLT